MNKLDYDPKLLFGPDYECDIAPIVVTGQGDYRQGYTPEPVRPSLVGVYIGFVLMVVMAACGFGLLLLARVALAGLAAYARAE